MRIAWLLPAAVVLAGCFSDASSSTTRPDGTFPPDVTVSAPGTEPSDSSDPSDATATSDGTESSLAPDGSDPGFTIPPPPTGDAPWAVDTAECSDPAAADSPITGTLTIGTTAPQSDGLISMIYAPVVTGFRAYIDLANADRLLGDVTLEVVIANDEGKPELTPVAVGGLLDAEADVISALPGSANNLAVRDLLNDQCVPQLMALASTPRLGDVRNYPWTMGGVVTDTVETTVYANAIVRSLGAETTVAMLVSNDADGIGYAEAFTTAAVDVGLDVVDRQLVEQNVIDPPVAQVGAIAATIPDVIVAALSGAACATFLTELDRVTTALPGLDPVVYLSSECADSSVLRLAGPAADGVLSSATLRSDDDAFVERLRSLGVVNGFNRAAQGWTAAEVTVAILVEAQQSAAGLTRASIIEAARRLSFAPTLALAGIEFTTNGAADAFPVESVQVVRYDATEQAFVDEGDLVVRFES